MVALFPASIAFELTDAIATLAARERWVSHGRRLFTPKGLVIAALSAAVFVLAARRNARMWWLILSGTSPALLILLASWWLTGFWWVPRWIRRRLAHLPHRQVTVEFKDAGIGFHSATERLEVAWTEVTEVRALPSFWLFHLRAGSEIPVPRALISAELQAAIRVLVSPDAFKDDVG